MHTSFDTPELIRRTLAGERVPLARAISWVENEAPGSVELLDACFQQSGRAFRLGITGPPGAGKSTLVTRLAQEYRRRGETVAIVTWSSARCWVPTSSALPPHRWWWKAAS